MSSDLLDVRDLRVALRVEGAMTEVIRGVDLQVSPQEFVGLVGESGSGKSMTARTLMQLLPPHARASGQVRLCGVDVLQLSGRALRRMRARDAAMIFQDPRASMNPVRSCGAQLAEVFRVNRGMSAAAARRRALAMLDLVRIRDPERVLRAYPTELSGGMLQRVLIAMAVAVEPALLIADEATTSLDVTVQADILAILDDMRRSAGAGLIFITHDLELASALCDRIVVMYAGRIVEEQATRQLFASPRHPYTRALLASRPDVGVRRARLAAIPGRPPSVQERLAACPFQPRCPLAVDVCQAVPPPLYRDADGGVVVCHRAEERSSSATKSTLVAE